MRAFFYPSFFSWGQVRSAQPKPSLRAGFAPRLSQSCFSYCNCSSIFFLLLRSLVFALSCLRLFPPLAEGGVSRLPSAFSRPPSASVSVSSEIVKCELSFSPPLF